jgi:hypothetical protein
MGWLMSRLSKVMPVLGKVKKGLDKGIQLYDKGRNLYTEAKTTVGSIPVVGNVANELIKKQEDKAKAYVKQKTGISTSDINEAVKVGREVSKVLPNRM